MRVVMLAGCMMLLTACGCIISRIVLGQRLGHQDSLCV